MDKKRFSVPFSLGLVVLVLVSVFGSLAFVAPVFAQGYGTENVYNGGCELGYAGWQTTLGNNEQSMLEAHAGNRSFLDSDDDSFIGHDFYQVLDEPVLSDDVGYLSFWLKTSGAVYVSVYLYYEFAGPVWEYIGDPITYADWTLVNSSLTSQYPGDFVTHVYVDVSCLGGGNKVYVDDISLTSDYSSGSSGTSGDDGAGDSINAFMVLLVPLVCMLIPAFLLGVVAKMGVWGVIIGLAIGTALAYGLLPSAFKPPLYVLFLVGLGIFGFIYSKRSG